MRPISWLLEIINDPLSTEQEQLTSIDLMYVYVTYVQEASEDFYKVKTFIYTFLCIFIYLKALLQYNNLSKKL